jgi:hypothetical protein
MVILYCNSQYVYEAHLSTVRIYSSIDFDFFPHLLRCLHNRRIFLCSLFCCFHLFNSPLPLFILYFVSTVQYGFSTRRTTHYHAFVCMHVHLPNTFTSISFPLHSIILSFFQQSYSSSFHLFYSKRTCLCS